MTHATQPADSRDTSAQVDPAAPGSVEKPPALTPEARATRLCELFQKHGLTLQWTAEVFEREGAPTDPRDDGGYLAHLLGSTDRALLPQLVTWIHTRAAVLGAKQVDAARTAMRVRRVLDSLERVRDPERFVASLVGALDLLLRLGDGVKAARRMATCLRGQGWPDDQADTVAKYAVARIPLAAFDAAGAPQPDVLDALCAVAEHWLMPEHFAEAQLPVLLGERAPREGEADRPLPVALRAQVFAHREWVVACFAREVRRRVQPDSYAAVPTTVPALSRLLRSIALHAADSRALEDFRTRGPSAAAFGSVLQSKLSALAQARAKANADDWVQGAMEKLARAQTPWNGTNSLRNYLGLVLDSTRPISGREVREPLRGIDSTATSSSAPPRGSVAPGDCAPRTLRALRERALAQEMVRAACIAAGVSDKQHERFAAKARGLSDEQVDPNAPDAVRRSLRLGRSKLVRPFMRLLRAAQVADAGRQLLDVDAAVNHVRDAMAANTFKQLELACYDYHFGACDALSAQAATCFDRVRKAAATPLRAALQAQHLSGPMLRAYDAVVGHSSAGRPTDEERNDSDPDDVDAATLRLAQPELVPSMIETILRELHDRCDQGQHAPVVTAVESISHELADPAARAVLEAHFMQPLELCDSPHPFPDEAQLDRYHPQLCQRLWHKLTLSSIDSALLAAAEPFFGATP